jgi:spermidine synthase
MTQGESPMFHSDTFRELALCLKTVFGKDKLHTLMFHATTYPSGMWSIQMAVKGAMDVKNIVAKDVQIFTKEKGLKYYNEELHLSSMVLPTFVRNMLAD